MAAAAEGLPRRRARRRQDLRHARRGPASPRARHRRGRRLRRDPRPAAHRGDDRGTRDRPAARAAVPRRPCSPRWTSTRSSPAGPRWRWSTSSRTRTCRGRATRSAGRTSRSCSSAGIDVVSTVNIQHLESVNDVVAKITGVPQRETVPDSVVRAADQVELVDMAPEALRRRMAHGNVYAAEKVDAALSNYFRVGNLTALRELALLWTADKVDEALQTYRAEHEIEGTWETRERVVVALTGGPEGETLVRRAARIAARSTGGELLAVHVTRSDGLTGAEPCRARGPATARRVPRRYLPPGPRGGRARGPARRSPAPRTPPSWCSARAGGRGWPPCSPGPASAPPRSATPATSTSTSSRTASPAAGPGSRGCAERSAGAAGSRASSSPWCSPRC